MVYSIHAPASRPGRYATLEMASDKSLSKPVEIRFRDETLKFSSVSDFEFGVAGRTAVPTARLASLFKLSASELRSEEEAIQKTEAHVLQVVSGSIDDPEGLEEEMRKLDPRRFSQEHGWRDIMKSLNEGDEALNPLRRVALAKYLQFLASLREAIGFIRAEKEKRSSKAHGDDTGAIQDFKATVLPGEGISAPSAPDKAAPERLPKGKAVAIQLSRGESRNLVLATHMCQLLAVNDQVHFIDEAGNRNVLRKGNNLIGRGGDSTVKLDSSLRDVSRVHLLIENQGGGKLVVTDLSAAGTFIGG